MEIVKEEEVSVLDRCARYLGAVSLRAQSRRVYERHIERYLSWCESSDVDPFDGSSADIARFLRELSDGFLGDRRMAYWTVMGARTALGALDRGRALTEQRRRLVRANDGCVQVVIAEILREVDRAELPKEALSYVDLIKICRAQDAGTLTGRRNIALFLVAWWGLLRGSELLSLRRDHAVILPEGIEFRVPVRGSDGQVTIVSVPARADLEFDPVVALLAWWEEGGITDGFAFRAVSLGARGRELVEPNPPSYWAYRRIVQQVCIAANIMNSERIFATQSFRRGAAAEALRWGVSADDLRLVGRWADVASVRRVVGGVRAAENPMQRLFRRRTPGGES